MGRTVHQTKFTWWIIAIIIYLAVYNSGIIQTADSWRAGSFLLYLPTVFRFSVTFVRPDQAAAPFTLPAGGCNYLRWVTTALCCTGWHIHPASVRLDYPIKLLSLYLAQSLHLHGWALGQRVFGQTSKCSVLLSSTCLAAARLFRLRSFFACPICEHCSCRRRIGIDYHLY
mgnify:CR=1 FL=1